MKVKELLSLISPLAKPEVNVYDVKIDKNFTYDFAVSTDVQKCIYQFGERTVMKNSLVFGEHDDETPFFHFIVRQ